MFFGRLHAGQDQPKGGSDLADASDRQRRMTSGRDGSLEKEKVEIVDAREKTQWKTSLLETVFMWTGPPMMSVTLTLN